MTDLEAAFLRILGFFPTYMRPPFLFLNDVVLKAMADLGYHVISASIDTKDFENDHPDWSWRSFAKFRAELEAGGNIVLSHDVHQTTVQVLVDNMLREIRARGLSSEYRWSLNDEMLAGLLTAPCHYSCYCRRLPWGPAAFVVSHRTVGICLLRWRVVILCDDIACFQFWDE